MDARAKTVREILISNLQYLIPFFQRSYSWKKQNWERLRDDTEALLQDPTRSQHFLGPLVCTPDKHVPGEVNQYQLIDGQQRLTTLTLLLVALRDAADKAGQGEIAAEIDEELLIHKRRVGLQRYKVIPRLGDREVLVALLDRKETDGFGRSSVLDAYRFFRKWADRTATEEPPKSRAVLTAVADRLSLVMITITGENPYEIFESLNSTGLPLAESDLIRNHVFMQVPLEQQESFNAELWRPFETLLETAVGGRALDPTTFYRDYLMRTGRYSKKRSTFVDFKEQNRHRAISPQDQVAELKRFLRFARMIDGFEGTGVADADKGLVDLRELEVSTANPLVLHLLDLRHQGRLSDADLVGSLRDLASFVLRRSVRGMSARAYGQWFVEAIVRLGDDPRGNLRQYLVQRGWPSNRSFTGELLKFEFYKREPRKVRLVLERLEDSYGHKERVDRSTLTVEHVLPQKPSEAAEAEWKSALGGGDNWYPVHQEWVHTLGNLTLTGYNRELSNRPYSEKRPALLNSNLVLNAYFGNVGRWAPAEIRQRGEALAAQVATLWPSPVPDEEDPGVPVGGRDTAFDIAGLREASIVRISKHLGATLDAAEEARLSGAGDRIRVVCLASRPHYEETGTPNYWFGITPGQLEYLREAEEGYAAFCCGSPDRVLLFTFEQFEPLSKAMHTTEDRHWHVHVFWGDHVLLDQPKTGPRLDVSQHLLGDPAHSVP